VLAQSLIPRTVLRAFWLRRRIRVMTARAFGRPPRIELYFAFDDPYGAVALPALIALAAKHGVDLLIHPVVSHGIANDPDLPLRRADAIVDAARLLRRNGQSLARRVPIETSEARFLAAWTEAARDHGKETQFAAEALASIWERGDAVSSAGPLRAAYERVVGVAPPVVLTALDARITTNEQSLRSRGHWETPAARVAGEWFFAHERLETIDELLTSMSGKS